MSYGLHLLWALANAVICGAICWACSCRIRQTSAETTLPLYRGVYAILLTVAAASAISPWWDEWPGPGCTLSNAGLLMLMIVNGRMWRHGVPPHARSDFGAFDARAHHHARRHDDPDILLP